MLLRRLFAELPERGSLRLEVVLGEPDALLDLQELGLALLDRLFAGDQPAVGLGELALLLEDFGLARSELLVTRAQPGLADHERGLAGLDLRKHLLFAELDVLLGPGDRALALSERGFLLGEVGGRLHAVAVDARQFAELRLQLPLALGGTRFGVGDLALRARDPLQLLGDPVAALREFLLA